jgi:hypothetical protein
MQPAIGKMVTWTLALALSPCLLAQGPQVQAWTTHPTEVLWFINAKNTTNRVVVIDGGTLSDCVEVTNCDGSGFSHGVILKPGDSAHVGGVNRAICTNPTDSDGNEVHQCEKRPPTVFKFQVFAKWGSSQTSSQSFQGQVFQTVAYSQSADPLPNRSDTTKWIQDTVATYAKGFFHDVITKVDGCALILQASGNAPPAGYLPYEQCKLDLSTLDPTRTTVIDASERFHWGPRVSLKRSESKPISCIRDFNHDGSWEEKDKDEVVIEVTDADIATRLSKAFVHAENLCGAKKPLF